MNKRGRKAHQWTADKLEFIEKYIPAFVKATKKATKRYYVDGFAGPGVNEFEDGSKRRGSPLIALAQNEFTRLYFVEENPDVFRALEQKVRQHPNKNKATLYNADFNEILPEILGQIEERSPTVFLLDPEGLELEWRSVEAIAKREKADLFILVSASGVLRNLENDFAYNALTAFFGDTSWMEIDKYKKVGMDRYHAIVDLYLDKLNGLGFTVARYNITARTSKKMKLHSLVFAAKNDVAIKIAEDVLKKLQPPPDKRSMTPLF